MQCSLKLLTIYIHCQLDYKTKKNLVFGKVLAHVSCRAIENNENRIGLLVTFVSMTRTFCIVNAMCGSHVPNITHRAKIVFSSFEFCAICCSIAYIKTATNIKFVFSKL